jgi:hypothetical protein
MDSDSTATTAPAEAVGRRLLRGAIGGLVAGIAFIVVTMWFASTQGSPPVAPFKLISTLILGAGALESGSASVPLGVAIHAVLSIAFGAVFALAAPMLASNGTVALAGGAYGALLFVVNFLVLGSTVFPQFQMPNWPFELVVHIVFGHLLAVAFYSSGVRRTEPFLALGTRKA